MEFPDPLKLHIDTFNPDLTAPRFGGTQHWWGEHAWKKPGGAELVQQGLDVAYWFGTVNSHPNDMLKRLFAILWHGGMMWRSKPKDRSWQPWAATEYPIASCLAHGGRLLIEYPSHLPVWDWLWGPREKKIERKAATHGILYFKDKDREIEQVGDQCWKHTYEIKTSPFTWDKGQGKHFGVNLAGGGAGEISPYSGNAIQADGRHGHLYMYHVLKRNRGFGAILVGAEDSAPLDCTSRTWGQFFGLATINLVSLPLTVTDVMTGGGIKRQPLSPGLRLTLPQGQTGAFHAFGVSGDYSFTGSEKFKKLGKKEKTVSGWNLWSKSKPAGPSFGRVPTGNDCIFVNPPDIIWEQLLENRLGFDKRDLGRYPPLPWWRRERNSRHRAGFSGEEMWAQLDT